MLLQQRSLFVLVVHERMQSFRLFASESASPRAPAAWFAQAHQTVRLLHAARSSCSRRS
jgi:hypothetical protein